MHRQAGLDQTEKGKEKSGIVTYCDGESCPLAEELAELLLLNGFENVATLKNGLTRWRESGLPVE